MNDNLSKIFTFIAHCEEPDKLRELIKNARARKQQDVADAAFKKLVSLVPSCERGTVAYDLWRTVYAFEHLLTEERGRTTRLARTRQKIARVGELQTLADWAIGSNETDGFRMLLERGLPELTGEAIVLRHATEFSANVVEAAKRRLCNAGVNIGRLPERL
jgi:hypothetical protein